MPTITRAQLTSDFADGVENISCLVGKNRLFENAAVLCGELRKATDVILSEGGQYGLCGDKFVRINVACSKELLTCALERIKSFFDKVVLF